MAQRRQAQQRSEPRAAQAPLIFIVEDNPITLKTVRLTLRAEGYRVLEAADGHEALAKMRANQPDLILLDLLLPDVRGVDLVKQLRALPGGADIPILAFSGFVSKIEEAEIAGAAFTDFLLKPVEPSRMVKTIKAYLGPQTTSIVAPAKGKTLLLADDDPVQRKLLRLQFEHAGFRVRTADNGLDAIANARAEPPDVIVSDVLMSQFDGFQLCLTLRQDAKLKHIPVVLHSANYIEDADRALGTHVGASAFAFRSQGFDALLSITLDSLARPAPVLKGEIEDLETERHQRIVRQLERQVLLNAASAQRNVIQSAILHELSLIADRLSRRKDLDTALEETLAYCLDSAGLSKGVLYMTRPDGALSLSAHYGCADVLDDARTLFDAELLLRAALKTDAPILVPSTGSLPARGERLLQLAHARSAIVVPVRSSAKHLAVLVLLSTHHDLLEEDWIAFGRALGSQIGQSIELSRSFYGLAESEARFRQLAENIHEVLFIVDAANTQMVYVSPTYESVWQRSCESLYAQPQSWADSIHPDDRERALRDIAPMGATGRFDTEYRIVRPDGTLRSIRARGFPIRDEAGKLYRVAGIAEDITEQKRATEELRRSEEKFRELAENINEVFWLTDPTKNRMLYISPAYESIWGRTCRSLYDNPRNWLEAIHPDDRERVLQAALTKQTIGTYDEQYRIVRPDGEIRWIRDRAFPIKERAGAAAHIGGVAEDITEQKHAADALRESERRFSNMLANVQLISLMLDREACVTYCNDYLLHLTGWRRDEVLGRNLFELFVPPELKDMKKLFADLLADSPKAWHHETEILTRTGARRLIRWNNSVLRAVTGEVIGTASIGEDITERKRAEATIQRLAYCDTLTGLPNRVALHERLAVAIKDAREKNGALALLLCNLRGLGDINDTLGHTNGDEVLKQVAQRLHETLWESDTVARIGGDEFAVLLRRLAEPAHIRTVVDKIDAAMRAPFHIADVPIDVQVAVGIALYPRDGTDAETLYQHADVALNEARGSHRPYIMYDASFDHYRPEQLSMVAELRAAIMKDGLALYYQPKVDIRSRTLRGVEALVRWPHESRGLVMPDEFIPLAEKTGLIDKLTNWVLRAALAQGRRWHDAGLPLEVSVNISARDLQSAAFNADVIALVEQSRFPARFLTLEITESMIMVDPRAAKQKLEELNRIGIGFSIDDFGTGYSSLAYLKRLPVNQLKIDKSFVIDIAEPGNATIVRSTIDLAHNLGLTVTAEGVESEAAFAMLEELKCDVAQGYWLSRPMPANSIDVWLHQSPWKVLPSA